MPLGGKATTMKNSNLLVDPNITLTQNLTQQLGSDIVSRRFSEGQIIPFEQELCSHYQVSRTTMREAVKMLTAKGLLSSRPKKGTTVLPKADWNLYDPDVLHWIVKTSANGVLRKEIAQVRLAIEPEAAFLAATCRFDDDLVEMHSTLLVMKHKHTNCHGSKQNAENPQLDFYLNILNATHNAFYIQHMSLIRASHALTLARFGETQPQGAEHLRQASVYAAIESSRPEQARAELRELLLLNFV
jgi:DNA-binding FadR family transcriptional regulator